MKQQGNKKNFNKNRNTTFKKKSSGNKNTANGRKIEQETKSKTSLFEHSHHKKTKIPKGGKSSNELENELFSEFNLLSKLNEKKATPSMDPFKKQGASQAEKLKIPEKKEMRPAWVDYDDKNIFVNADKEERKLTKSTFGTVGKNFSKKLAARYQKLRPTSEWAKLSEDLQTNSKKLKTVQHRGDRSVVDISTLLKSSTMITTRTKFLRPTRLRIRNCKDVNREELLQGPISVLKFHPQGDLLMCAGEDKKLYFYKTSELGSTKVHSIIFPDLPIFSGTYIGDGSLVAVSGRRKFFYYYDLTSGNPIKVPNLLGREEKILEKMVASPDGKYLAIIGNGGSILIVSNQTKQYAFSLKMNGICSSIKFSCDSNYLYAAGSDAELYKFDIRTRRCVQRFMNQGSMPIGAFDASPSYTVVGDKSGVVNIYENEVLEKEIQQHPIGSHTIDPKRTVMNLTTPVTSIKLNFDSQLIAVTSFHESRALRVIHLPSCTVYSNWPTEQTKLGRVSRIEFSPSGGFLSLGNKMGRVLLYRLEQYATS